MNSQKSTTTTKMRRARGDHSRDTDSTKPNEKGKNKKMGKARQDKNEKKAQRTNPFPLTPSCAGPVQQTTTPDPTKLYHPTTQHRPQSIPFQPRIGDRLFHTVLPTLSRALCIQRRSELGLSVLRLDMSNIDKQAGYRAQVSKLIAQGDSRDRDFFQCAARSFVIHSISHIPSLHQHHAVSFHRFLHKHFPRISNGIGFLPFILLGSRITHPSSLFIILSSW
ncbi:hypothetical protein VTJ04DRAFT_6458 [Mycothermus thermophilus]|uniref:uncharacterized protein n=1 Tax=Humicola insolens TaxID=85995 RepID=UPI003743186B